MYPRLEFKFHSEPDDPDYPFANLKKRIDIHHIKNSFGTCPLPFKIITATWLLTTYEYIERHVEIEWKGSTLNDHLVFYWKMFKAPIICCVS